jgi:hypothetical protein
MEAPAAEAEAFIPMESVINSGRNIYMLSNSGTTTTVRRKAAKRTFPWDLKAGELNLAAPFSPPQQQDEDIPATKKLRLDPAIRIAAAATNDVILIDLCSDSNDEKPKPKEDSSPTNAIVGTYAISSLLEKKRTPMATATAESAANTASPVVAMALPLNSVSG